MRILVLGAYGMLGHKLFLELRREHDVFGTCRNLIRDTPLIHHFPENAMIEGVLANELVTVEEAISISDPKVIINCIGIVKQLREAKDPLVSIRVNSLFPHELSKICARSDRRLIHFSTDCVFSGKVGNYSENDIPDPVDLYGRSKLLGEMDDEMNLTIRSSIIGPELQGNKGLLEWFVSNNGGQVNGFTQSIFSGLTTLEMSRAVGMIVEKFKDITGVWHLSAEPISKYDLLSLINERMKLNITLVPDSKDKIDRSLDSSQFREYTGYTPPDWPNMIDNMIIDYRKEKLW